MKKSTWYSFFRPTLIVIVCYLLATLGVNLLAVRGDFVKHASDSHITELASNFESLVVPDPSLSAKEVVRIQLDGLASKDAPNGILQCMAFASPGNRALTGPLERFGRMVRSKPFDSLAAPDRLLIGEPKFVEGNVRILVTLVKDKELRSFVWVLAKQSDPPFQDCWMTEGVIEKPLRGNANYSDEIM